MEALNELKKVLKAYQKVAIAYSGGCDSHFLYSIAKEVLGKDNVLAVLCIGDMMSLEDVEDAQRLLQGDHYITVPIDVFSIEAFKNNQKDRCYYCKKMIMSQVIEQAHQHGFQYVLDGQNKDDESVYRPGIRACQELGILSPLAQVHMSKEMIRKYSQELHIETYHKPSNACLASRFPYHTLLTKEKLNQVAKAESILHQNGMIHSRVRAHENIARIEIEKNQFELLINNETIVHQLEDLGFDFVTLDLKGIRSGSYDR